MKQWERRLNWLKLKKARQSASHHCTVDWDQRQDCFSNVVQRTKNYTFPLCCGWWWGQMVLIPKPKCCLGLWFCSFVLFNEQPFRSNRREWEGKGNGNLEVAVSWHAKKAPVWTSIRNIKLMYKVRRESLKNRKWLTFYLGIFFINVTPTQ